MRIRVWVPASRVLSKVWISIRIGREPKISRATKFARVSSSGVAPVSPVSRGQKVMPAPFSRSLTTWVSMFSRRSGWFAIAASKPSRSWVGK